MREGRSAASRVSEGQGPFSRFIAMKATRGSSALLLIGVAFVLQGCNQTIIENMKNSINTLAAEGCQGVVTLAMQFLRTKGEEQITTTCAKLLAAEQTKCTTEATAKLDEEIAAQKTNQTAVCTAKVQALFNSSNIPDLSAISKAAADFEFSEGAWEESWLKGQLTSITCKFDNSCAATPATARLYETPQTAPLHLGSKVKDNSSPLAMLGAGAGAVLLVVSVAVGIKGFLGKRREARDADCESLQEEIE